MQKSWQRIFSRRPDNLDHIEKWTTPALQKSPPPV